MRMTDGHFVPGFAVNEIRTAQTALDLTGVEAIRVPQDADYFINGDNTKTSTLQAGFPMVIDVDAFEFSSATTVEIMKVK